MAKIKYSALVSDMRNKLNGSVMSKNRYGSYVRNKVTPVNPQSTAQQTVRQRLGSNSQAWRGLTEEQRQSWIEGAANFPVFDIFGDQKILSGSALFVSLNNNLAMIGAAALTTCPVPVAVPSNIIESVAADVSDTSIEIGFSLDPVPANFALVLQATPLITPGVNFVKNRYRFTTSLPAATATGADIYAAWNTLFGSLVAGQKVFVRGFLVSTTTGQAGVPSVASTIVVA